MLLDIPVDKRKLVSGAVPVVNVPQQPPSDRENRLGVRVRKRLIEDVVNNYEVNMEVDRHQHELAQVPRSVSTQTQ